VLGSGGVCACVLTCEVAVDFAIAFQTVLPHGLCVGVTLPGGASGPGDVVGLDPAEQRHAATLGQHRRTTWIAGRLALRAALAGLGVDAAAILADERGAPVLPRGVVGSISHKRDLAVAMVAIDTGFTLGVDIERCAPSPYDIGRRVLARDEQGELAELDELERGLGVMLRFSLKEAIYKAIDPVLRRHVGFGEVMVTPRDDGTAEVRHCLERPFEIHGWWTIRDQHFLTSARARLPG
jgi:enterobactin synthetase component D